MTHIRHNMVDALRAGPPGFTEIEPVLQRAAAHAMNAGAADLAYAEMDSLLGPLVLAATARGLVTVAFAAAGSEPILDALGRRVSPKIVRVPARLDVARRQIDDYLAGRRRDFDVTLDWLLITPFQRLVLENTVRIPYGGTATYADVAAQAGSPRGARAAGNALRANPLPLVIPCHRVLPRGGDPGGYAGGTPAKVALLGLEAGAG